MPSSKFIINHKINDSFRTKKIKGLFDVEKDEIIKEYNIDIPIEQLDWNVGLIVGASGTGKTTIATNCFKDYHLFNGFEWSDNSIVDDFSKDYTINQIVEILSKVGFSSPPDWLKPFSKLSNGQKMRVELARLCLETNKPFIYDEFTSVVDRQVAQIGSSAIQKYVRKNDKQFIAVSCHYDIIEWLQPDWIFDVNTMEFRRYDRQKQPDIFVNIRKADQSEWKLFKDFHYLDANHNRSAHKYIAEINNKPVAWCSILPLVHPKVKNTKRIHRIVVLPDYQGIGLGTRLLNEIAEMYRQEGFKMNLVTSSPSFIYGLQNNKYWYMIRKPSRVAPNSKQGQLKDTTSEDRLTATFTYYNKER